MQEYEHAVSTLLQIVVDGKSMENSLDVAATPLARQIIYGVIRDFYTLEHLTTSLLDKPLPSKHTDLKLLLYCGIYSIRSLKRPAHASVNAVVETSGNLKKKWAKALINAVLRSYIRQRESLDELSETSIEVQTNHPAWLVDRIGNAWPESLDQIISVNNEQPPMVLRVNKLRTTRQKYLGLLANNNIEAGPGSLVDSSIVLEVPCSVDQLPGFDVGLVSVQDEASQLAAHLMVTRPGDTVLDACAAPGGKTCHLLEANSSIELVANDKDRNRLNSVKENLKRLGLSCELTNSDLLEIKDRTFKKILLDAPCSATGIIRRHPDIKLLRRNSDIDKLCAVQFKLLNAAWALLEQGGDILYSTCSVLPEENEGVLRKFIHQRQDVEILPIHVDGGVNFDTGFQLLPTSGAHDGFYFAHLRKIDAKEPLVSNEGSA